MADGFLDNSTLKDLQKVINRSRSMMINDINQYLNEIEVDLYPIQLNDIDKLISKTFISAMAEALVIGYFEAAKNYGIEIK